MGKLGDAFLIKKEDAALAKAENRRAEEIDYLQVEMLAQLHLTKMEMATALGMSIDQLNRRIKEDDRFVAAVHRGESKGKMSLRRIMFMHAQDNYAAAIFLSKNLLGWADGGSKEPPSMIDEEAGDDDHERKQQIAERLSNMVDAAAQDREPEPASSSTGNRTVPDRTDSAGKE